MTLLVPSTMLSYINADLGPDPSYAWITVSWSLGAAVLASIAGRLADIFGRRYFMLFGSALSFIGTIIGATGQSINQMIVSGVIFGVAAGFQEMGFSCIMEFVPNKYRLTFMGKLRNILLDPNFSSNTTSRLIRYECYHLPHVPVDIIRLYCPHPNRLERRVLVHDCVARLCWNFPLRLL